LLDLNPILRILDYGEDALLHLRVRAFDRVINLDAGKTSAALASAANGTKKDGFILDARGYVQPTNSAARKWLEMGVFDDLKRQGTTTYQDMMADIVGLTGRPHRYVLQLTDEERERAGCIYRSRCRFSLPVHWAQHGAGRWELKQWREEGWSWSSVWQKNGPYSLSCLADRRNESGTNDCHLDRAYP
jgi:hypothetical protein